MKVAWAAAWITLLGTGCDGSRGVSAPDAPTTADTRPDVILVSLDTTRADMVDAETTPTLAALAATGTRFAAAYTHAPTTASSHASVFTGLDPHAHGVVRNGHRLRTDVPTLAERFGSAGWDTAGFVAASVLDRATGLDRGFAGWTLDLPLKRNRRHEAAADHVTDLAVAHLGRQDPARPLLLFVHYYDAHGPYDAPAPWTRRFGAPGYDGPVDGSPAGTTALADALRAGRARPEDVAELRARYRGELAFVDSQLARLLAARRARPTLMVVFADHGEALGDTATPGYGGDLLQPIGHGADVDLVASHVPLVLVGPGVPVGTVARPVALSSLGTTLLARAGLPTPLGAGVDLLAGGPDTAIPLEATQPLEASAPTGWPNARMERGVVLGDVLVVETPWRTRPPAGYHRDAAQTPAPVSTDALTALRAWDAAAPGDGSDAAQEQTEALRALGYAD